MSIRRPSGVALGLGAFAAGVGLGLGGAGLAAGGAAVVAAPAVPRRVRGLALLLALGAARGWWAHSADLGTCAAVFRAGPMAVEVELREPAASRRPVAATVVGETCSGTIAVALPGEQPAGSRVAVSGQWRRQDRPFQPAAGVLVATGVEVLGAAPTVSDRIRNHLVGVSRHWYGPRAGMVDALVLGRRSGIERELVQAFSRSGLAHLLAISGFHVGLVWAWLVLLIRLVGGGRWAGLVAAVGCTGYVAFLGFPAPASRAVLLALLSALERRRQRRPAPGPLFALTALLVLAFEPWAVGSLGAWFSVAAIWGATAATRWVERALGPDSRCRLAAASVGASLATAPIAAGAFGVVPVMGIALNLLAIPLTAFAVPAVLGSQLHPEAAAPNARALA
ncbi:MAG: ComEC/Rec2 family competence protein, partial [Gemmatimonadales bacterium]